ncbi:glutaminase A [Chitinophagaceae bacterium LB-8]|uniref:Glutaminase n=1 Tax=Paraflavisolibacter caeni TaxID=2982496 RepID=A0A9X2XX82_9BACT|nr:glutaminase A [Paraflavisolibacter caeni]MCU7549393.1 glutaminase A [Paraflavisolibacter caeni]
MKYLSLSHRLALAFVSFILFFSGFFLDIQAQEKKKTQGKKTEGVMSADKGMIEAALTEAYNKFKDLQEGKNADYIKELANVDPNIFGIALVTTDGQVYTQGDITSMVSIQSVSKVFTMAKVIEEQGPQAVRDKIGVDATGMRFNSIVAVELQKGKEINPLVNPGAIAASSLINGSDSAAKWKSILDIHSDFAGRPLTVNEPVYISEAGDNLRNQAIAHLLKAYNRMYFDPVQATDIYTKQCAINVNAKDLATMAATLANGGVNPITKKKVVSPETVMYTLPVMATAGLYDDSGQWLYTSGLPAKSGVGGGLLAVCPGKFGIAVVSPPLDAAGNSVKAQKAIAYVVEKLKADPYLIQPKL